MARIRPFAYDGRNDDSSDGGYDGPPPPPGVYRGHVKRGYLTKYKTGNRVGGDRLAMLIEIDEGQYKGAGIWHSLSPDPQGTPYLNGFLEALTDGTEAAKKAIRDCVLGNQAHRNRGAAVG